MAKIFHLRTTTTPVLQRRKAALLQTVQIPPDAVRASCVRQFLTCGKANCRCQRGMKHGPFHYLVQCVAKGHVRKFLLKTPDARRQARVAIAAYNFFQEQLEELSQINTELLRRSMNSEA